MQIGVAFPTTDIGHDLGAVREYIQTAEELGYSHIRVLDHVLGAVPELHPEMKYFVYTHESYIHEPMTLMAYFAAITTRIELVTSILILPQRQTVLTAKQAAEVDFLSGGRLRLGVGLGWNPVEYEALGENFRDRGKRCEEQIEALRALWTEPVVNFQGAHHRISHAGLNPMPVQRPIPLWIGGGWSGWEALPPRRTLRRIGRLADGWFAHFTPSQTRTIIEPISKYAEEAGRDPATIGIEGRLVLDGDDPEPWLDVLREWKELGATHVGANAPRSADVDTHLRAIRRLSEALQSESF